MTNWLDAIHFNADGLVPVIAQDWQTGQILMMAWANAEALCLTLEQKTAVYFSRSRQKLWHKGETSGHTQKVHEILLDCDGDVILLKITQIGGIACHTGRASCFYQKLDCSTDTPTWQSIAPVIKDPAQIYAHNDNPQLRDAQDETQHQTIESAQVLKALDTILQNRKTAGADTSYVASLYHKGLNKILEKVGEEATETILAGKDLEQDRLKAQPIAVSDPAQKTPEQALIYEIADVWFHTLVVLAWFDLDSDAILQELARRFGLSGLDEKAARGQ